MEVNRADVVGVTDLWTWCGCRSLRRRCRLRLGGRLPLRRDPGALVGEPFEGLLRVLLGLVEQHACPEKLLAAELIRRACSFGVVAPSTCFFVCSWSALMSLVVLRASAATIMLSAELAAVDFG